MRDWLRQVTLRNSRRSRKEAQGGTTTAFVRLSSSWTSHKSAQGHPAWRPGRVGPRVITRCTDRGEPAPRGERWFQAQLKAAASPMPDLEGAVDHTAGQRPARQGHKIAAMKRGSETKVTTNDNYAFPGGRGSAIAALAALGGVALIRWGLRRSENAISKYAAMGDND